MQAETESKFYYIKTVGLKDCLNEFERYESVELQFRMGTKFSDSLLKLKDGYMKESVLEEQFNQEAHIFQYDAEQVLTVFLTLSEFVATNQEQREQQIKSIVKNKKKQKRQNIKKGIAKILLPPLIEYPQVKHSINVQVIFQGEGQIKTKMAILEIELYFLLNFKAEFEIVPLQAHLVYNVVSVGEMRPYVEFMLEGKKWRSEEVAGGIHPKWAAFFYNHQESNPKDKYDSHCSHYFDMRSAGSDLNIKIYSTPFLGSEPIVIGKTKMQIQKESGLKLPRKFDEYIYETREVVIYREHEGEQVEAGKLKFKMRFNFNRQSILRPTESILFVN